jgi:hypothetical protein
MYLHPSKRKLYIGHVGLSSGKWDCGGGSKGNKRRKNLAKFDWRFSQR